MNNQWLSTSPVNQYLPPSDHFEIAKIVGKDPHFIHLPEQQPFMFAGLWAHNHQLEITSCTILTAKPDPAIADIHDRMPIILKDRAHDEWLNPETPVDDARELLTHHRGGELQHYRVGRAVNSNKASGPELIAPIMSNKGSD